MHSRRLLLLMALLATGAVIALLLYRPPGQPGKMPIPMTISTQNVVNSGLLYIAEAKGFFTDEGLALTLRTRPTGYEALQDVLRGDADAGAAAETPIAKTLAEGKEVKVIATIFSSSASMGIVARRDHGITKPRDLKGKRIGVVFGTSTHYMLEAFLAFHGIPVDAVTLVAARSDAIVDELASGELDAAASWNPHLARMQQRLGDKAQTFHPAKYYAATYNLAVRPDYLPRNRDAVDRLLRALLRAESFAGSHPAEADRIISSAIGFEAHPVGGPGDPLAYEVTLKQSLLLATENEVAWHFRRGLVPEGPFPDVLEAFEPEPLHALKPSGVSIVK